MSFLFGNLTSWNTKYPTLNKSDANKALPRVYGTALGEAIPLWMKWPWPKMSTYASFSLPDYCWFASTNPYIAIKSAMAPLSSAEFYTVGANPSDSTIRWKFTGLSFTDGQQVAKWGKNAGWYVTFITGPNAGVTKPLFKNPSEGWADGNAWLHLLQPMPYTPAVGDLFVIGPLKTDGMSAHAILGIAEAPVANILSYQVNDSGPLHNLAGLGALYRRFTSDGTLATITPVLDGNAGTWSFIENDAGWSSPQEAVDGGAKGQTWAGVAHLRVEELSLNEDSTVPTIKLEVQAKSTETDASPADVVIDLLTRAGVAVGDIIVDQGSDGAGASSYRTYCAAMGFRVSRWVEGSDTTTESLLTTLLEQTNAFPFFSNGKWKIIPLGDVAIGSYVPPSTAMAIGPDDLAFASEDYVVQYRQTPEEEVKNAWPVTFQCRDDSEVPYQDHTVETIDQAHANLHGVRRAAAYTADWVKTTDHAQKLSSLMATKSIGIRGTYSFRLPPRFSLLEPMDFVTLTDPGLGLVSMPCRIQSIDEQPDGSLDVQAMEWPAGLVHPLITSTQPGKATRVIRGTSSSSQSAAAAASNAQAAADDAQVSADAAATAAGQAQTTVGTLATNTASALAAKAATNLSNVIGASVTNALLAPGCVTASKMVIGDTRNLCFNPNGEEGWTPGSNAVLAPTPGYSCNIFGGVTIHTVPGNWCYATPWSANQGVMSWYSRDVTQQKTIEVSGPAENRWYYCRAVFQTNAEPWSAAIAYPANAYGAGTFSCVYYNGGYYVSTQSVPAGVVPTNTTYWRNVTGNVVVGLAAQDQYGNYSWYTVGAPSWSCQRGWVTVEGAIQVSNAVVRAQVFFANQVVDNSGTYGMETLVREVSVLHQNGGNLTVDGSLLARHINTGGLRTTDYAEVCPVNLSTVLGADGYCSAHTDYPNGIPTAGAKVFAGSQTPIKVAPGGLKIGATDLNQLKVLALNAFDRDSDTNTQRVWYRGNSTGVPVIYDATYGDRVQIKQLTCKDVGSWFGLYQHEITIQPRLPGDNLDALTMVEVSYWTNDATPGLLETRIFALGGRAYVNGSTDSDTRNATKSTIVAMFGCYGKGSSNQMWITTTSVGYQDQFTGWLRVRICNQNGWSGSRDFHGNNTAFANMTANVAIPGQTASSPSTPTTPSNGGGRNTCVDPASLVVINEAGDTATAYGLRVGDQVWTQPEDGGDYGLHTIEGWKLADNFKAKVTVEDGRWFICSINHLVRVNGEWRRADSIQPGEVLSGQPDGVVASVEQLGEGPVIQLTIPTAKTFQTISHGRPDLGPLLQHNVTYKP